MAYLSCKVHIFLNHSIDMSFYNHWTTCAISITINNRSNTFIFLIKKHGHFFKLCCIFATNASLVYSHTESRITRTLMGYFVPHFMDVMRPWAYLAINYIILFEGYTFLKVYLSNLLALVIVLNCFQRVV